ncbi:MAG: hypothetical protein OEZ13_02975 [Spirochaetia bacterium]|nr:hypothetical protein [Spirochaetia bacterium]
MKDTEEGIRKSIRYESNPLDVALIAASEESVKLFKEKSREFKAEIVGIIENESHFGCNLVVILTKEKAEEQLNENSEVILKLGSMLPHPAVVRWKKLLKDNIYNLGIQMLE